MTNQQATHVSAPSFNTANTAPQNRNTVQNSVQIIIGPVVWDFINVFKLYTYSNGDKKYTITLIVSKNDERNKDKILNAITGMYLAGCQQLWKCDPSKEELAELALNLFRDGDEDYADNPLYQYSFFLRAKSFRAPFVCDINGNPINRTTQIYSGAEGNAIITFRSYDIDGKKCIACYLESLQLVRNGSYSSNNSNVINAFKNFNQVI